jgi:excinuclease ABC subunit A
VIEHNLDVVKSADWLVDLGPEGGAGGGSVIAEGTPEEVAANPESHTGVVLHKVLPTPRSARRTTAAPAKQKRRAAANAQVKPAAATPTNGTKPASRSGRTPAGSKPRARR